MKSNKINYYKDELNDEFSGANITPRVIDENYKYIHKNPLWNFASFLLQNVLSMPIKIIYGKTKFRIKYIGKEKIKSIIPQREPFLMIDEIEEYIPGESAICYKDVKEEEWYFKGHFPGNPIMPGVLITESLAQAGAIAILSMEENKGKNALFGGIDKMKFKKISTYNFLNSSFVERLILKKIAIHTVTISIPTNNPLHFSFKKETNNFSVVIKLCI